MVMGGTLQVSVFDKKENRSYWLMESVPSDEGYMLLSHVKDANGNIEQVTLQHGEVTKEMLLATANIDAIPVGELAVAQPSSPSVGPPEPTVAGTPPKADDESTDEEVRGRMKRVAEEIRRRRAMRSQILKEREQGKK